MKHSRLGDGVQIASPTTKDLGILCSINTTEEDDKYVLGSYNNIALWNKKTKEAQIQKLDIGGKLWFIQVSGLIEIMVDMRLSFLTAAMLLFLKKENQFGIWVIP